MYELKFVWQHLTLIMPSLTAHRKSIAASIQKLPNSVVSQLVQVAIDRVNVSDKTITLLISLRLAIDFFQVMFAKDKQMLVRNFIFDLLLTGRGSSVSSVAILRSREVK
jgi:hypothetical protein